MYAHALSLHTVKAFATFRKHGICSRCQPPFVSVLMVIFAARVAESKGR